MREAFPKILAGRYRYVRDLGTGGMGRVVLIEDLQDERREKALKWVPTSTPPTPDQQRHVREFAILSRFEHPHLIAVEDFQRVDSFGGQFFICECLRGPELADVQNELDTEQRLAVLTQVLRGLAHVHDHGFVHGDLKPQNILLREPLESGSPAACLIDFGTAHEEGRPAEQRVVGTAHFMSPEHILGARLDRRSDLYAFGVLLYQWLTGKLPCNGRDKDAVFHAHIHEEPVPPASHDESIAPVLSELTLALLAKKPEDRPASARHALETLLEGHDVEDAVETSETLVASVRQHHCTGWESTLADVKAHAGRRFADKDSQETPRGLTIVRHDGLDVDEFRRALLLDLHTDGFPTLHLDMRESANPIADLLAEIEPLRSPTARRRQDSVKNADTKVGVDNRFQHERAARTLARVAGATPFAVLLTSFESAQEPFLDFLSVVYSLEAEEPNLKHVAWIAFQSQPNRFHMEAWQRLPETRRWMSHETVASLDPEATRRWLDRRFPDWELPDSLVMTLEEKSAGNPQVLQRVLESMMTAGILGKSADGWCLRAGDDDFESQLIESASEEFAALPHEEQALLCILVVLEVADRGTIARIHRATEDLDGLLARLCSRAWIEKEPFGARFRFQHDHQREAARRALPDDVWKRHNEMLAKWQQKREKDGKDDVDPARLSRSLSHCGQQAAAIPYALRAAKEDRDQGRILAAIRWLEGVLDSGVELGDDRVLAIQDQLGDLWRIWGPAENAERCWLAALEMARSSDAAPERRRHILLKLAEHAAVGGDHDVARRRIDDALENLDATSEGSGARHAEIIRGELLLAEGDLEALAKVLGQLRDDGASEEPALEARAALLASQLAVRTAQCADGVTGLETAAAAIRRERDPLAEAWWTRLEAERMALEGAHRKAAHEFHLAARRFAAARNTLEQARSLLAVGELQLALANHDKARSAIRRAEFLFDRLGCTSDRARLCYDRALLLGHGGWSDEAREQLKEAEASCSEPAAARWSWSLAMARAEIAARRGWLGRANKFLQGPAAPTQAPHHDQPEPWVRWGLTAQRVALATGTPGDALKIAAQLDSRIRQRGGVRAAIPLWITHWQLLVELGCRREARGVQGDIEGWLEEFPDRALLWRAATGALPFDELSRSAEADTVANHLLREGVDAFDHGESARALIYFGEALDIAKRARAMPLQSLIAARLAVTRAGTSEDQGQGEQALRRAWRGLVKRGIVHGRFQVLALWARYRELTDDERGARALIAAARKRFIEWSSSIPIDHDLEAIFDCQMNVEEMGPARTLACRVTPSISYA